jgi:hypothetical protein
MTLQENGIEVVNWDTVSLGLGHYAGARIPKDMESAFGDGFWNLNETSLDDATKMANHFKETTLRIVARSYSVDAAGHLRVLCAYDPTRNDDGTPRTAEHSDDRILPPPPRPGSLDNLLLKPVFAKGVGSTTNHTNPDTPIVTLVKESELARALLRAVSITPVIPEWMSVVPPEIEANADDNRRCVARALSEYLVEHAPPTVDFANIRKSNYEGLVAGCGLAALLEKSWGLSPTEAQKVEAEMKQWVVGKVLFTDTNLVLEPPLRTPTAGMVPRFQPLQDQSPK